MGNSIKLATASVLLSIGSSAFAQELSTGYPPASGHMQIIPPSLPAPGAVGSNYVETFPSFGTIYQSDPMVTTAVPPRTVYRTPRVRGRLQRGVRMYSRGYSQAPAPYAAPLPQGQLYWPGSAMAPGYTPFSRYQTYGQGYQQSPYGSNFWGGYYKGFSLGY